MLEKAKRLGTNLVVGVAGDRVVEQDKGTPPIISSSERARLLEALRIVTKVVVYNELDFINLLDQIKPDVIAVGEDWGIEVRHQRVEHWADTWNVPIVRLNRYPYESTTDIKNRILESKEKVS